MTGTTTPPPSGGSAPPLLVVEQLSTTLQTRRGPVRAVDGVDVTVDEGRTLGVVGESGSGKSMLVRSIMGLQGTTPVETTGSVRYHGTELLAQRKQDVSRLWGTELAMIFQDPMTSLNPVLRIGRQLTEHLRAHLGLSARAAKELGIELLRSVQIPRPAERFRSYPHELSGGMRQRVCIAIALACGPHLLFADEPTTALDVTVQRQILALLDRQQRERKMAMILVTHDLGVVEGRTDDVAVMYAGRIVERGPTRAVFAAPRMPYTEALLRSSPSLEHPPGVRLPTIIGRPADLLRPPPGCRFHERCPYAQPVCAEQAPPLVEEDGRAHACWFPVGSPEGAEAWDRNVHAGRSATIAAVGVDIGTPPASTGEGEP